MTAGSADGDPEDDRGGDDAHRKDDRADREHLRDVEDGCGCAEVWEHLAEYRERADSGESEGTGATGDGG